MKEAEAHLYYLHELTYFTFNTISYAPSVYLLANISFIFFYTWKNKPEYKAM